MLRVACRDVRQHSRVLVLDRFAQRLTARDVVEGVMSQPSLLVLGKVCKWRIVVTVSIRNRADLFEEFLTECRHHLRDAVATG